MREAGAGDHATFIPGMLTAGVTTAGDRRGLRAPALHVRKQTSDPCGNLVLEQEGPLHGWAEGKREERQGGEGGAGAWRPPSFGLRDRGPPAGTCSFPAPASWWGGGACTHPEQPCPEPGAGPVGEG